MNYKTIYIKRKITINSCFCLTKSQMNELKYENLTYVIPMRIF